MIISTGVDIVKVERFAKKQNPQFIKWVFSAYEQDYLAAKGPQSMAGLFAAKEAVAKAMGTGFVGFLPCEIEILHDEKGKPHVRLHGKAAEKIQVVSDTNHLKIHISISHSDSDAIAFAVLETL